MKIKTVKPEPQKYVKFYFEDGLVKTDTNMSSIEILGTIERIKNGHLQCARIQAEEHMKKQKEVQDWKATWKAKDKSWIKMGDNSIKYKKYEVTLTPKKKVVAKKIRRVKKK